MDTRNFPILAHNSAFHKLGNACALAIETLCMLSLQADIHVQCWPVAVTLKACSMQTSKGGVGSVLA